VFAVVSPAKKLAEPERSLGGTTPVLMEEIGQLATVMRGQSSKQLGELMKISANLADLNYARYQTLELPFTQDNASHAALMFAGDTYVGLDAATLSDSELEFAQNTLGILSGLYGLLRPLDLIQPYRLEMGTRLQVGSQKNLYAFWDDKISKRINEITESHDDRTVVNLASNEYFTAVKPALLEGSVITPAFKELRNGKAKVISFMAKRARGAMARYIVQNRLASPEGMKTFTSDGYRYMDDLSTDQQWVFLREN
jgi:uncharacterized protein